MEVEILEGELIAHLFKGANQTKLRDTTDFLLKCQ